MLDLSRRLDEITWDNSAVRILNVFKACQIFTVGDLVCKSAGELLELNNFGVACLLSVKKTLEGLGFRITLDLTRPLCHDTVRLKGKNATLKHSRARRNNRSMYLTQNIIFFLRKTEELA